MLLEQHIPVLMPQSVVDMFKIIQIYVEQPALHVALLGVILYEAKNMGKNRCARYSDSLGTYSGRRLDMEKNMRDASPPMR